MATSKKRSQPAAPSEIRPSKKRKSAEAGKLKMKEIFQAEDLISEVDPVHVGGECSGAIVKEEKEMNVRNLQSHEIEPPPVVAPGFRLWDTTSRLASRGELSQVSKFDHAKEKFTHMLNVQHTEAFTLVPLIVTQGPYKGNRVFMLQSQGGFRFLELPPEIRTMIYACITENEGPISISTHKRPNEARRPVLSNYNQPAFALNILRASKQVLKEVAPMMYSNNEFRFNGGLSDLKVFLDRIGSMRAYVRHIHIGKHGYQRTKATPAFHSLKGATDLRTLSFHHTSVSEQYSRWDYRRTVHTEGLAYTIGPLLKALRRARTGPSSKDLLEIVKFEWDRCTTCAPLAPAFPENDDACLNGRVPSSSFWGGSVRSKVKCKDAAAHCKALEEKVRGLLKKELGIKE